MIIYIFISSNASLMIDFETADDGALNLLLIPE